MIEAVSDTTKDVVVPIVAAGIAALIASIGIAIPILVFRRQELARAQIHEDATDRAALDREIKRLRNNVYLLREMLQRFGLEQTLTAAQQQVVESARDRTFQLIYSDQRLLDSIVPKSLDSTRRVQKLMLMLGELESRLRGTFTPALSKDPITLFGLYVLCYFLAADDDVAGKAESREVLEYLKEKNAAAGVLFTALFE